MIYLSWSYAYLAIVIIGICAVSVWAFRSKVVGNKTIAAWTTASILLSLFLAFDVGTRQEDLQRGSFDAQAPSPKEKVSRETMSRDDAKQTFEQVVKESK